MSSAFNVQLLLQTTKSSERQYINQYRVVVRSTTTFPAHLRWSLPAPVPVCQAWLQRAASPLLEVHHRPEDGERKSSTRLVATRGSESSCHDPPSAEAIFPLENKPTRYRTSLGSTCRHRQNWSSTTDSASDQIDAGPSSNTPKRRTSQR